MISNELQAPAQRIRACKRRAAHPQHWLRPTQGDKEKPMTQSRASEPARRILAHAGLRTSLPRLVVLSAFHEQDAYTVEELYQRLREPTNSITRPACRAPCAAWGAAACWCAMRSAATAWRPRSPWRWAKRAKLAVCSDASLEIPTENANKTHSKFPQSGLVFQKQGADAASPWAGGPPSRLLANGLRILAA